MFDCLFCTKVSVASFKIKVVDDAPIGLYKPLSQVVIGHDARVCNGLVPVSPFPISPYCGCGDCAAEWKFIPDPTDPTHYVAEGSALKGNCCLMCTNHNGDNWYWNKDSLYRDADHLNTAEKPGVM